MNRMRIIQRRNKWWKKEVWRGHKVYIRHIKGGRANQNNCLRRGFLFQSIVYLVVILNMWSWEGITRDVPSRLWIEFVPKVTKDKRHDKKAKQSKAKQIIKRITQRIIQNLHFYSIIYNKERLDQKYEGRQYLKRRKFRSFNTIFTSNHR